MISCFFEGQHGKVHYQISKQTAAAEETEINDRGKIEDGTGDAVLFLHGFTTASLSTEAIASITASQQPGVLCLTMDFYGGGLSASPATAYTEELFTSQVRELLDHLGIQRVVLVGNSMGAVVGAAFAHTYPSRVSRLVCIGPGGIPIHPSDYARSPLTIAAKGIHALGAAPWLGPFIVWLSGMFIVFVLCREWVRGVIKRLLFEVEEKPLKEWEWQILNNPNFFHAVSSTLREFSFYPDRSDLWEGLHCRDIPLLFVSGSEDFISPHWVADRIIRNYAPHARKILLDGAGHSPNYDSPDMTFENIRSFVVHGH
uniref:AB hydrolase-1 domain-containing protein n=1 Tax=Chromera velia CCMP2878 TaxID=1169474 RepID=A0A0G4HMX5_9ALVE|mmetsp:Transcript_19611/g.39471  ORF Transcript_19611/g.39471 Transcript_19611/m.39471 type:complete len:314 (+) Transcript_19611:216-1157(+)|eukprot:Cvel_29251.t1-p1 / transcript=Cvel_29251.t1 / gene=Cvel_29251 / organism=Chromera_velia_CCMP2878 / gene_product=Uncharacterized protein Mb2734, putative / transcript_product=Uncharacterized protein Mb2734, putative / location=Cvel_scaffold3966:3791-4729(+) / protein_length=313 / sequence_SO=supercontig / SO=protein_coding / is_pseudo=false